MKIDRRIRDFAKFFLSILVKMKYAFLSFFGRPIKLTDHEVNEVVNNNQQDYENSLELKNRIEKNFDLMVVIPAYNCADTIKKCIDSVLNQITTFSYQIVVVNDGSTDGTQDVLKEYDSEKNVRIVTQKNKGFSGARNTALRFITGEYVFFLDSDDFLPNKNAIQSLLELGYENNADVVEGSAFSFYYKENNREIVKNRDMRHSYEGKVKSISDMYGYPWGKIYKSELFRNLEFPEGLWYEDTIISMIVYPKARVKILTNALVYAYQINMNGITHSSKGKKKTIDTYYVTKLCVDEELKLGLINQETEKLFLNQLAMNYSRLKYLPNKVNDAVALLSIKLYQNNFFEIEKNNLLISKELKLKKALADRNTVRLKALLSCWYYL